MRDTGLSQKMVVTSMSGNGSHPETAFNAVQTGRHVAWSRAGCAAAAWTTSPVPSARICARSAACPTVASFASSVAAQSGRHVVLSSHRLSLCLYPATTTKRAGPNRHPPISPPRPLLLLEFVIASRLTIHSRPICHRRPPTHLHACVHSRIPSLALRAVSSCQRVGRLAAAPTGFSSATPNCNVFSCCCLLGDRPVRVGSAPQVVDQVTFAFFTPGTSEWA